MLLRRLASTLSASTKPAPYKLPPTIKQLLSSSSPAESGVEQVITVSGWIKSIRRQKNVSFAVLTDGSSSQGLQAVFVGNGEGVKSLTNGTAVQLTGKLVTSPGAGQDKELLIESGKNAAQDSGIRILGSCDPETYPIQKQALSTEYLRDHSHLRARTDTIAAMVRLRDDLKKRIGTFFDNQGFIYSHTPILTGNDAEGAGESFRIAQISSSHPAAHPSSSSSSSPSSSSSSTTHAHPTEFFSRPAHLTVSHQLHLEALATTHSRVYTLSPCFRAEPSLTGRHLAEFWMLEAEWAFADRLGRAGVSDTCDLVEACLREVVRGVMDNSDVDLLWKAQAQAQAHAHAHTTGADAGADETKRRTLIDAVQASEVWTRMTYTDAIKILEDQHRSVPFQYAPAWGRALQSEHERWIAETLVQAPVFITDYPAALKPFYMRSNSTSSSSSTTNYETVACFDLVVPGMGELVGGSVREERADVLEAKMKESLGEDLSAYQWYLDLRRFGGAPHMGFGMGFERLVAWVGGIENVRESIPFPRWAGRMLL